MNGWNPHKRELSVYISPTSTLNGRINSLEQGQDEWSPSARSWPYSETILGPALAVGGIEAFLANHYFLLRSSQLFPIRTMDHRWRMMKKVCLPMTIGKDTVLSLYWWPNTVGILQLFYGLTVDNGGCQMFFPLALPLQVTVILKDGGGWSWSECSL